MAGRGYSRQDVLRMAKAKRASALARVEFRLPSDPRVPAAGVTSAPLKKIDNETERLIAEALAKKGTV